jgi:hydrogenase nickel incorporation protein HypA/HybF
MHELSIAMSIIEIVEEQAKIAGEEKVQEIELDIGKASGVVVEALRFSLEEAVNASIMKDSTVRINEIPSVFKCLACGFEFEPEDVISPCPECGHLFSDVISGKELKIKKITF